MKRRINYTDRKRITRDKVDIILNYDDGKPKSFVGNIDLADLSLPADARVYIEAYHRTDQRRFDFGKVNEIKPPTDTGLINLAYTENIKFRILVVDERGKIGLILAHADRIKPFEDVDKKSILPVEFKDIGQKVWKVEYTGDEGGPILLLNDKLPNIESLAKSNPLFFFFVYPAVVREILTHIIFIDSVGSVDEPFTEWHDDWLKFAKTILSGEGPPSTFDRNDENYNIEDLERWIDRVVDEFSSSKKEWYEFIKYLRGEESK